MQDSNLNLQHTYSRTKFHTIGTYSLGIKCSQPRLNESPYLDDVVTKLYLTLFHLNAWLTLYIQFIHEQRLHFPDGLVLMENLRLLSGQVPVVYTIFPHKP